MKSDKSRPKQQKQLIGRSADEWAESLWEKLVGKITEINSKNEIKAILESLISKDEKKMMLRRLAILALINEGKSYQEIGEILWVSSQTISTVKKNSLGLIGNYKSYRHFYGGPKEYSVMKTKKDATKHLFDELDILDLLMNPPRPPGIGLKDRN